MKVLQVCQRYTPYIGGLETHVREISEELVKRGFEVDVATTDPSGKLPKEERINGVNVRRFKSWAPKEAYYFSRGLQKYLFQVSSKYAIIHAHGYHSLPAVYAMRAKSTNKLVFTPHYHGKGHTSFRNILLKLYKNMGKKIFENADAIICVSNYERNQINRSFKIPQEKFTTVPNGLNLSEFKDLKKHNKSRRTLLCVSRLEHYKGINFIIEALPKLDQDIILQVVGKGPYFDQLFALATKLGVLHRVQFFHDLSREELLQMYADANLFLLLSKYEAYGIAVGEALMSKTPCIVANTSALQEWVDNVNCFGITYPPTPEQLTAMINHVINNTVTDFKIAEWSEVVDQLTRVYEKLSADSEVG